MCHWKVITAVLGFLLIGAPAFADTSYLTDEEQRVLAKINASQEKRTAALEILNTGKRPDAGTAKSRRPAAAKAVVPVVSKAGPDKANPFVIGFDSLPELFRKNEGKVRQYSGCAGLNFLLRQDWQDIGYLKCPQKVEDATGAQISFTDDRAASNRIWAMHGTAALYYSSVTGDPSSPLTPYDTSVGTYVTVNRSLNSSAALMKSDIDKLAYGGMGEFGFVTENGANYFRVRGGGIEDNIKNVSSANITGEFLPVYYPLHFHEPFRPFGITPFILRYDPLLLVQYNQTTGRKTVLDFNNRAEALRVGPQVTFTVLPLPGSSDFLSRLSGSLTYHWAYETYSQTGLSWLQSAVKYNIDDAGHLAVALTYQRGRDEDTGTFTNVYKIALTGKI
jgi:hypothetical protein